MRLSLIQMTSRAEARDENVERASRFIFRAGPPVGRQPTGWSRRSIITGELFPWVGFFVTNLTLPSRAVVRFYNKRGTSEQQIKEGKQAVRMTRLTPGPLVGTHGAARPWAALRSTGCRLLFRGEHEILALAGFSSEPLRQEKKKRRRKY